MSRRRRQIKREGGKGEETEREKWNGERARESKNLESHRNFGERNE